MRGVYQTAYLEAFAQRLQSDGAAARPIDIGRAFDLIVGTSTGGIVACALAAGKPLANVQVPVQEARSRYLSVSAVAGNTVAGNGRARFGLRSSLR